MANRTGKLYIRSKSGYRKPPKRLIDLAENESYYLTWYEGTRKKATAVGRFADAAQIALINREAELRKAAIPGTLPTSTLSTPPTPTLPQSKLPTATPPTEGYTSERCLDLAIRQYLTEVKNAKSHSTWLAYEITLRKFSTVCTAQTIESITRQHILDYMQMMRDKGSSPCTLNNRVRFLKTFFVHFDVPWPMKATDKVRVTKKRVEAYSRAELQGLFTAANEEEQLLFEFFLYSGFREQEVMHCTWSDVNFHTKKIRVSEKLDMGFIPKDGEEDSIPVPDSFIERLQVRREQFPNSRLIFALPNGKPDGHMLRTLQQLAYRAGLNCGCCINRKGRCCTDRPICHRWGLHKFRRTFATMHHESGISARKIQKWLRHSSLDTTLRYLAGGDDSSERTRAQVNHTFAGLQVHVPVPA